MTGTGLRHRLAAILAVDAAGYSRLMSIGDRATVAAFAAERSVTWRALDLLADGLFDGLLSRQARKVSSRAPRIRRPELPAEAHFPPRTAVGGLASV